MAYGDPMGYRPLREVIAEYLGAARAVRCSPDQIMVVSGSQQGLQICAKVLSTRAIQLDGRAGISRSSPGLPTAGVRMVPIPGDDQGISVKEGLDDPGRRRARI